MNNVTKLINFLSIWCFPENQPERADSFGNPCADIISDLHREHLNTPVWDADRPCKAVLATDEEVKTIKERMIERLNLWTISTEEFIVGFLADGSVIKRKASEIAAWIKPQLLKPDGTFIVEPKYLSEESGNRRIFGNWVWQYAYCLADAARKPFGIPTLVLDRKTPLEAMVKRVAENRQAAKRQYTEKDDAVMATVYLKLDNTLSDSDVTRVLGATDYFRSHVLPFARTSLLFPEANLINRGYGPVSETYVRGGNFQKNKLKGNFWASVNGSDRDSKVKTDAAVAAVLGIADKTVMGKRSPLTIDQLEDAIENFFIGLPMAKRTMATPKIENLQSLAKSDSGKNLLSAILSDDGIAATTAMNAIVNTEQQLAEAKKIIADLAAENASLKAENASLKAENENLAKSGKARKSA